MNDDEYIKPFKSVKLPITRRVIPSIMSIDIESYQPFGGGIDRSKLFLGSKFESPWSVVLRERTFSEAGMYLFAPITPELLASLISEELKWLRENEIPEEQFFVEYSRSPFSSGIQFKFGFLDGGQASEFKLRFVN